MDFYVNKSKATNSLLKASITETFIDEHALYEETISVKTVTLDSFMEENAISEIDILKLDVQGGELMIFNGAEKALKNKKIKIIYAEIWFVEGYEGQPLYHDIAHYLSQYGYKPFGVYNIHYRKDGHFLWGDAIFIQIKFMIYLAPHSGLANRIRVIVSGLSFSDKFNHELTVIWNKDKSLYCSFSDLFETNEKIIIKNKSLIVTLLLKAQNSLFIKKIICKFFSIDFTLFDSNMREFVWSTGSNFIDYKKLPIKGKNYLFATCHEFHFESKYFKFLTPVNSIQFKIDKNSEMFTLKTVGVHIRRGDHLQSIKESPLQAFVDAMELDLIADSEINFYLATDDQEVETLLTNKFPGKIIVYKKDFSRETVKGIQDAMVDLYSLANTCKIYGSYFSSFSDIASRIRNIPLVIIKKDEY